MYPWLRHPIVTVTVTTLRHLFVPLSNKPAHTLAHTLGTHTHTRSSKTLFTHSKSFNYLWAKSIPLRLGCSIICTFYTAGATWQPTYRPTKRALWLSNLCIKINSWKQRLYHSAIHLSHPPLRPGTHHRRTHNGIYRFIMLPKWNLTRTVHYEVDLR